MFFRGGGYNSRAAISGARTVYKNPYGNQPIQISIVTNLYINPHFKQHKSQW